MKKIFAGFLISAFLVLAFLAIPPVIRADSAQAKSLLSVGQTIYVPAYSHIYIGNRGTPYFLTVTLSIRNIDPKKSIRISEVSYYETQGKFLKNFISEPVVLSPLGSTRYIINANDKVGGSGANFIVKWSSKDATNPPIIEAVMIGTQSQQGISFTSRGVPIIESDKKTD